VGRFLEIVISWAIKKFGEQVLTWTVQKLIDAVSEAEPAPIVDEKFIWDEREPDLCRPYE
jgi:hypothetical protein